MIDAAALLQKHKACEDALDPSKTCNTCAHRDNDVTQAPCTSCYDTLLGFPVNPTKWEAQ